MERMAAWRMWFGVEKSGSPTPREMHAIRGGDELEEAADAGGGD